MGTPGSTSDITGEDVWRLFARREQPYAPSTADEVADELECHRRTARDLLTELAERGELGTRRVDDTTRVWWRSGRGRSLVEQFDQEEFAAFVTAVEDYAIFMLDPDGRILSWNEGAERIKGYAEDEIVGEHFSAFYTDEDVAEGVPERNLETAAEEGRVEDEGWRVREDGSRFWANVTITAIRDDDGALQGFTKVTRDMTERRAYEQQLRRERDLTEQILETVPVSISVLTPSGTFVRANSRALERLDIDESELGEYTADSWDLYDDDGTPIPAAELPWRRAGDDGDPVYDFQCQVDLPDIGRRWLSINAAPLPDYEGEGGRVVLSVDDITERKDRERQLRREHDQTEKLLRTAPIAIAVQDAEGNTVLANRRAQEALGLSEREIVEEADDADEWDLYDASGTPISPDETPSARVLATGEPVSDEELIVESSTGERKHFRVNAAPVSGPDGAIERVITASEEITELKKRERQLEQRKTELETELNEIVDRISDAFYALDDEWRFTHVNEQSEDLLRRSREELIGERFWDVFPEATDATVRDRFHAAMESQESVSFEMRYDSLDVWVQVNAYPSETGLSVYFQDISRRIERERELERYRTIVETVNDGIYVKDEDGYFTMVNDAYAELTGYDRGELVGAHASLVVDEDAIQQSKEILNETAYGGTDNPALEAELRTADGGRVPVEGTFATFQTSDGEPEEVGVVRDISERKEYQRKLEESNERLEQFAYAASHDLQEPLRMVSSYLQLIEGRYADELGEDGREFLEYAVDGADRMRQMIEGLLQYSRVETQGDPLEVVDLDAVLSNVRDDLQLQIAESDAEITVESLPRVEADASQLRQVFQNLLENAIAYSGDEPPRIRVSAERTGDAWEVSVRDEGIGIDPDEQERIFEVFQRLHTREEHTGTGIGLALCQRIVERHGGEIRVESEPGEGATFSFTLPAVDGA